MRIYNDLDSDICNLFRVLRNDPAAERLAYLLERTPFSRDEYKASYQNRRRGSPIERARKLIVRSCMGQSSKGIWITSGFDTRLNDDAFISRINSFSSMPEIVTAFVFRLKGVVVENSPAVKFIPQFNRPDCLIYCDPPYLPSTRSGARVFRNDLDESGHRDLARVLQESKSMVILSGYPCDLYDKELYSDWHRFERKALADGARQRTEVLWLNEAAYQNMPQKKLDLTLTPVENSSPPSLSSTK